MKNKSDYQIVNELGKGSFGVIYKCKNKKNDEMYAIKVENKDIGQLKQEYTIYKLFKNTFIDQNRQVQWPQIYDYGYNSQGLDVLVMDLYGPNLDYLFKKHNTNFNNYTIAYLAQKMITLLQIFHSKGYIHRDLKPQNFVIGLSTKNLDKEIFLIDYGISKKKTSEFSSNRNLKGTVRYASINTHLGCEQSFRDDLCSIGYIILNFAVKRLLWQNKFSSGDKKELYSKILLEKLNMSYSNLPLHESLKEPIIKYLIYVNSLQYDQIPDYKYLLSLFDNIPVEPITYLT